MRSKYVAAAEIALRQGFAHRGATLGRVAFYFLILLIFSRLWKTAVPGAAGVPLLWYLAITEWVMLSVPLVHLDIEQEVRQGDFACRLPRPASWVGMRLAEGAGTLVARLALFLPAGIAGAWFLAGGLPKEPRGLLLALPIGALAAFVALIWQAAIGVASFWVLDASPVYWIWNKLCFVLGGLMLPLHLYPGWLRSLAAWTPFPALLSGPGSLAFGLDRGVAILTAGRLLLWGTIGLLLLQWLFLRGLRAIDHHGG